jgi:hypothetical protein
VLCRIIFRQVSPSEPGDGADLVGRPVDADAGQARPGNVAPALSIGTRRI